jgi:hypothetical protein
MTKNLHIHLSNKNSVTPNKKPGYSNKKTGYSNKKTGYPKKDNRYNFYARLSPFLTRKAQMFPFTPWGISQPSYSP